jgi:phosphatidylglycerol:prolipoprotein diacylglycerol transferase
VWPILLRIGDAALFSYALFASLAYFAALALWYKASRPYALKTSSLINLSLLAVFSGWFGARFLYLLTQLSDPSYRWSFWELWKGGVVFYGGALAGALALFIAFPKAKIDRRLGFNTLAPAMALAHGIGRIGCFLNGCCFGTHCDLPWGVKYDNPYSAAPLYEALHPVQLYESFLLFGLSFFLYRHLQKPNWPHPKFQNWGNIEIYVASYAVIRFGLEYFRGDLQRGSWGPFSTSQWIALGTLFLVLFMRLLLDFRGRRDHN